MAVLINTVYHFVAYSNILLPDSRSCMIIIIAAKFVKYHMKKSTKFNNKNTSFSKILKSRVNEYFNDSAKRTTGGSKMYQKTIVLIGSAVILYSVLVFATPFWLISILLCILLGINFAAIGFNIMHDAGHNSLSSNKNVNTLLSYSLNALGGNIYLWKLKHNIAHHTYTNIEGEDHDIEIKFLRIHDSQEPKSHHRYQHFYFPVLYAVSYLAWIFFQDYEKYFRRRLGKHSALFNMPNREKWIFWISKVLHFQLFITIPFLVVGWLPALIGLLVAGFACGICLATVFQLAHVVSETEFTASEPGLVEDEWTVHQLSTTANFATHNKVLTWLLGGLNFQVEHHLFPKISHIHYPEINKIVKNVCEEFRVNYIEFASFGQAWKSHTSVIKSMSR